MTLLKVRSFPVFSALLSAVIVLGACSSSGSNDDDSDPKVLWNYGTGSIGPNNWANLSTEFATCGSGQAQSPIDITVDPKIDVSQFSFDYREEGLDLKNENNTMYFTADAGGDILIDGIDYNLKNFHIHVASEHRLKGQPFEGEIHFYHESSSGQKAVVAVWLTSGVLNKITSTLIENFPVMDGETFEDSSIRVNPTGLLPSDRSFYRYDGSLTQPPCTEGVTWIVMRNPIEIGASQLAFFSTLFGQNVRPIQPLNGRVIIQLL